MGLVPFPVERFAGLNLRDDPAEVGLSGAIDCLNTDLDKHGRVRTRDGFDNFTTAAANSRYFGMAPWKNLYVVAIKSSANTLQAISTSGGISVSASPAVAVLNTNPAAVATIGTPSSTRTYIGTQDGYAHYFDGTSFTAAPTGLTTPIALAVQPTDNRLVCVNVGAPSRVLFSDAGAPDTFGANNYVDISPGDGEQIWMMAAYSGSLFVFKESKFAVFYGNSTDSSGNPVFNYRMEDTGVGIARGATGGAVGTPYGVFFVTRQGIYVSTGGAPTKVSGQVDPIFLGDPNAFFASSALNQEQIGLCSLAYHRNRLYFAFPSGSATANDRMLVYDLDTQQWTLWDMPAAVMCPFPLNGVDELLFAYASGSNHIGRHSSAYSNDDGTAIVSRYRSGFSDLGYPGQEKTIRESELVGQGSPTFGWSRDFGSITSTSSAAVTLGTAPAVARKLHRKSQDGEMFSWQASATSGAWQLNRLTAFVRDVRGPAETTS